MRAKKPPFYSSHYEIKPIRLDNDGQEALAKTLGIEGNEEKVKAMVADVEEILTMYQAWVEDNDKAPTPVSKIITLESLRQSAQNVFNGLRGLDVYTKQNLYMPFKGSFTPKDPEADFQADVTAVVHIIERINRAIDALTPHKKQGRREKNARKKTMIFLSLLFNQYAVNDKAKARLHFISEALNGAKIPHPDPDDQKTKFDKLLKGPF